MFNSVSVILIESILKEVENMVKMDKLQNMIKYTLWTAYIKGERPTSLLIIAQPEAGKTSSIEKFSENEGIVYFNDITPWGLTKEIYKLNELGKPINHLIIPDLLNILSKNQTSEAGMIQFLNTGLEEGLTKIKTYGIEFNVGKTIKFGLITAITDEVFNDKRRRWRNIGFLSRMIPFSFKYSISDIFNIVESIKKQEYHNENNIKLDFPKELKEIQLDYNIASKLDPYRVSFAEAEQIYGFRFQKQLQTLLKAVALSKGKDKVEEEDLNDLMACLNYCNTNHNFIQ